MTTQEEIKETERLEREMESQGYDFKKENMGEDAVCEMCVLEEEGLLPFKIYNPTTTETKEIKVCNKCLSKLVDNYFSPVKSGSW